MDAADEAKLYLSVLTLSEIRKCVAGLAQSRRRTRLETWLEVDLRARFLGRIVPIDAGIADRFGWLAAEAKRQGKALPVNRRVIGGDRAAPQPYRGFAECARLRSNTRAAIESVGSVKPYAAPAWRTRIS